MGAVAKSRPRVTYGRVVQKAETPKPAPPQQIFEVRVQRMGDRATVWIQRDRSTRDEDLTAKSIRIRALEFTSDSKQLFVIGFGPKGKRYVSGRKDQFGIRSWHLALGRSENATWRGWLDELEQLATSLGQYGRRVRVITFGEVGRE